jgi:hypothetical protein
MANHGEAAVKESPTEAERKLAEQNLQTLGSEFAVAQEWGLFPAKDGAESADARSVLKSLETAAAAIKAADLITANNSLLEGRAVLNRVHSARPYWFAANNRFGFLPLVMTIVSGAMAYRLVFVWFLGLTVPQMLHHPVFFGWVGAILKSLYWLQYQINKGLLRPRWFTYFMIAPIVGLILGGIAALVVSVGFRIAHGSADWQTVALVAAFAGFNWEWALEKFRIGADAVSSRLFEKKSAPAQKTVASKQSL